MKISIALAVAAGLTSIAAFAQSSYQSPGQSPGQSPAAPAYHANRVYPAYSQPPAASEEQSSGSSSASGSADNGSGGQLITESIVQSHGTPNRTITLQAQTENGITYLCGGVGSEESDYLKKTAARDFNLMMTFAARTGDYVANVGVTIADARGNPLVQTNCDGPLMLVEFPQSGTYRIHADAGGRTLDRTLRINAKSHVQTVFAWPAETAGVASTARDSNRAPDQSGATSSGATSSGASGNAGASHKRYGYEEDGNGRR